jgi:hypothetical protein
MNPEDQENHEEDYLDLKKIFSATFDLFEAKNEADLLAIWNGLNPSEADLERTLLHMESLNARTKSNPIDIKDYLEDPFVSALMDRKEIMEAKAEGDFKIAVLNQQTRQDVLVKLEKLRRPHFLCGLKGSSSRIRVQKKLSSGGQKKLSSGGQKKLSSGGQKKLSSGGQKKLSSGGQPLSSSGIRGQKKLSSGGQKKVSSPGGRKKRSTSAKGSQIPKPRTRRSYAKEGFQVEKGSVYFRCQYPNCKTEEYSESKLRSHCEKRHNVVYPSDN